MYDRFIRRVHTLLDGSNIEAPNSVAGRSWSALESPAQFMQGEEGEWYWRTDSSGEWLGHKDVRTLDILALEFDYASLATPAALAQRAKFMTSHGEADEDAYVVSFVVRPSDFATVAPEEGKDLAVPGFQDSGQALIGEEDFLTRRVEYVVADRRPWSVRTTVYAVIAHAFDEPVAMAGSRAGYPVSPPTPSLTEVNLDGQR